MNEKITLLLHKNSLKKAGTVWNFKIVQYLLHHGHYAIKILLEKKCNSDDIEEVTVQKQIQK